MKRARSNAETVRRLELEDRAEKEAAWFLGELGGRVPAEGSVPENVRQAAKAIDGWIRSLPTFSRGALTLRYTRREWPEPIQKRFGGAASLVVRLECALHPAVGLSIDALERAAVERIARVIAEAEAKLGRYSSAEDKLGRLEYRAMRHVHQAVRVLAELRGRGPSLLPLSPSSSIPAADEDDDWTDAPSMPVPANTQVAP